jgi:hypothetical protein
MDLLRHCAGNPLGQGGVTPLADSGGIAPKADQEKIA